MFRKTLLSLVCFPGLLTAENWPEFRGPTAQGHSSATGLPIRWSATQNVVWKSALPGVGWSSPVVVDGVIYLTTAVAEGEDSVEANRSLRAIALSGETGSILWDVEVFQQKAENAPRIHKKNSHASPTPVWEEGRLYVHFGHQGTACLNAGNGEILWSTRQHSYAPVHGNGSSPVVVDGLLVFSADGGKSPQVIALDKLTGKTRWKFARESDAKRKFSFCTPLLIEVEGEPQIISPGSGMVAGLNPSTGAEIWRLNYDQGYSVVPRPVLAHGLIFVGTGYDKPRGLAIRIGGKGDITDSHLAWEQTKYVPHNPSMIAVGDELYMVADNGILSCMDAKTGEVHYQERCTGPISASILYGDGHLYLLDERGSCSVVKPGKSFTVVTKNALGERALASPAVIGSDLLLRTEEHLYRVGKAR